MLSTIGVLLVASASPIASMLLIEDVAVQVLLTTFEI